MKKLLKRYEELIVYVIVGVITTIINFVVYYFLTRTLNLFLYTSNVIAWLVAVIFAFISNKFIVFKSMDKNFKTILNEGITFLSMRIISLGLDMLTMYIVISIIGWSDLIGKILSQITVVISNYIFSKLYIFKTK